MSLTARAFAEATAATCLWHPLLLLSCSPSFPAYTHTATGSPHNPTPTPPHFLLELGMDIVQVFVRMSLTGW